MAFRDLPMVHLSNPVSLVPHFTCSQRLRHSWRLLGQEGLHDHLPRDRDMLLNYHRRSQLSSFNITNEGL